MTRKQALALLVKAYNRHGGGSLQHLKALKRYENAKFNEGK